MRYLIPEILTYEGRNSSFACVYRNPDQAVRESRENARFMRNDPAIMECLEARQRAVALLSWRIEPLDQHSPDHRQLAAEMTEIVGRTPLFTEYRRNLLEALWYGRYACQNVYGLATIRNQRRVVVHDWLPLNGDKLVFRYDDGTHRHTEGQVGIRTTYSLPSPPTTLPSPLAGEGPGVRGKSLNKTPKSNPSQPQFLNPTQIEFTDQGPVYFLTPAERPRLTIHKHVIEDGTYEDPLSAGRIHGVGIRDRIYWCWYQKQETMAQLMETIERTGSGFTIYYYPAGNPHAKQEVREVAESQTKSNIILMPRLESDPTSNAYGLERIEPSATSINSLQQIVHDFFELQIKRFILGQTLSSEPHATGLGSGVADLHQDTFAQIVQYDAIKLEETLTQEFLRPLQQFNFPRASDVELQLKLDYPSPQSPQRLATLKTAWDMGAAIRMEDVLDAAGVIAPQPGDDVLCNKNPAPKTSRAPAASADSESTEGTPHAPTKSSEDFVGHYAKRRVRYSDDGQEEVPVKNPDFEMKHPREGDGKFAPKGEGQVHETELTGNQRRGPNSHIDANDASKFNGNIVVVNDAERGDQEQERRSAEADKKSIYAPKVGKEQIELITDSAGFVQLVVYDTTGKKWLRPRIPGVFDFRDRVTQVIIGHKNADGTICINSSLLTGKVAGGSLGNVSEEELKLKLKNLTQLTGLTTAQMREEVLRIVAAAQKAEKDRRAEAEAKTQQTRRRSDVTIVTGNDGSTLTVKNADPAIQQFYKDQGSVFVQPNHDRTKLLPKSQAFEVFKDDAFSDSVQKHYLDSLELEKAQHPDYWLDKTQDLLDLAGNVPVLGAVPDLLNAAIYAARGDSANASLATFQAIPFVGDAAGTAKAVGKARRTLEALRSSHRLRVQELAAQVRQMADGPRKAAAVDEILSRTRSLEALQKIESSLDDIAKHIQSFSDVASFRKSIDDMADNVANHVTNGHISVGDLNAALNRRYDEVLKNLDVPGKGKLPRPSADERVTIDPTRLDDPKFKQNTVKNHITSMLGEEDLVHQLHTQTDEIVLKWGHHISTNGNDVITFNPKTKTVTLWDNKVSRKERIPRELEGSGTYNTKSRKDAAIEEAQAAVKNSGLSDQDRKDALRSIENSAVRMITAASGNYDRSVIQQLSKKGNR